MSEIKSSGDALEEQCRIRCFMDGIDWQHHLDSDINGTKLFPSVESLKEIRRCVETGGCGAAEVEVRLIRWVEPQHFRKSRH